MKKIVLCVLLSGLLGIAMTSCQKENDLFNGNYSQTTFNAYVAGSGDKTFLDGLYIKWNQHDKISIAGTDRTSVYHVKEGSIDNNGQSAIFQCQEGEDVSGAPFVATYPAGSCSATSVTLPEVQTYNADSNILGFPMYATSNDHTLHFQNLCSALKLTLQKEGAFIKQIIITTDQQIVGQFSLSDTTEGGTTYKHVKAATSTDATHNSVTLDCGNGVSIASAKDFYIYLPVGTYNKFIITAITTTNATFTLSKKSTSGPMYFNRNHIKYLHPSNPKFSNTPTNGVGGLYSVSPDHRVYIAHGNLRAIKSTSGGYGQQTTWNWSFFPQQYGTYHGLNVSDTARRWDTAPSTDRWGYIIEPITNPLAYEIQKNDTLSYFTYGYGRNTLVYNSTESNGSTDADYVEYGEQPSVIN